MAKGTIKILVLIELILLSACSSKPYVVENTLKSTGKALMVYVVNHGWHTGFVIQAKEIQEYLPQLHQQFGNIPYIELGWGDKGFYQAQEITSSLTLRAIFWPTESVIHAVAVPERPDHYFSKSQVEKLCLRYDNYLSLVHFIANSFDKNKVGEILELKRGIYGDSQFYKGVGDYYLMNTCNKWTAKGLKSAGLELSPTFKLTASSVMNALVAHQPLAICLNQNERMNQIKKKFHIQIDE